MKEIGKRLLIFGGLILSLCFIAPGNMQLNTYATEAEDTKGSNIIIALDVSGSMVATDENRLSIEMIEMLIDLCDEKDAIGVVAYNDFIVYQSGLVPMSEAQSREQLKEEIRKLEFKGETDNGLGLKTAIDILTQEIGSKESYVLFISDGKTDLANSQSERTKEQSQTDWDAGVSIAVEKGIQIHAISFVNEYSEDTTEMTIASDKTGGMSSVVANPLQFTKAIVQTWFAYQGQKDIQVHTQDITQELTKLEIDTSTIQSDEITFLAVTTENLNGFEIFSADDEVNLMKSSHYAVAKIKTPTKDSLYALFSGGSEGILSWSLMDSGEIPVVEEMPEEPKEPEPVANPPVVKQKMNADLYLSKGLKTFDVSTLFEDVDGDIVKYEIEIPKEAQIEAELQGTMLSVTPKANETVTIIVTATDTSGLKAQTEALFQCIPQWKEYYSVIVWMIIAVILIITGVICFFIYRFLFKKEEAKTVGYSGILYARFIDLKSKNDIPPLEFSLAEYPPQELSLNELLESVGIYEDLPDLENVHFAPYKKNQIRFVHDTRGGVFIGEEPLAANQITVLEAGTTIYISFAENASEYELRYMAKGMK